ncbi:CO(2)-response secreted protease-like [Pyrus x bretschneideri]|uniref:CO(2)-response secreted protease-like n=1 Tax=Pyrus x bretschneideri TaxID=225117 RepID=UPI002030F7A2|nr:CO(2)-response secreted protease-like [Pyrus x bretschneideri]
MRMKNIFVFTSSGTFLLLLIIILFHGPTKAANDHQKAGKGSRRDRLYIVYMGSAAASSTTSDDDISSLRDDCAQLLSSVVTRKPNAVVHTYKHGFSGFAARLSDEEARSIASKPGVVSVFLDPILKLHTTHSWDFLKYQTAIKIDSNLNSNNYDAVDGVSLATADGSDTIIGILDTGIWPESESFNDKDMGPIPSRWKGTCMKSDDFSSSNCNRKLIGARFYSTPESDGTVEIDSPRDTLGHGSHVAGTAAGTAVPDASYYGVAAGTAIGGSPGSRIAMYKVCSEAGCRGSDILAAFDDAIADGVDVLSLSLGSASGFEPELSNDPIAIGAFHAVEQGITVVCSAGNDGPYPGTVVNAAPWILTVGATTIDRDFESDVVLGGGKVVKGRGINFSELEKSPVYPLIYSLSARKANANEHSARYCEENSMEAEKIKGKIVLCDSGDYSREGQIDTVKSLGGVGVIFQVDNPGVVARTYAEFPATVLSFKDGQEILSYINSTRNPVATVQPTVTVMKYKPAPTVVYFSARGPASGTRNILKPDIAAPGVNILAPWLGNDSSVALEGKDPPLYNVLSGTSMSCPHVSGIAATVKAQNPAWGPSAIRSAIITTASQTDNLGAPITTDKNSTATPYDYGAGEVTTTGPLQPGLVYETGTVDYLNYLCYYGYNISQIKTISKTVPKEFACPKDSNADYISNINYPSIAISNLNGKASKNVTRTVTNVAGDGEIIFTATVDAPSGLTVKVIPDKLQFSKNNQKLTYQVVFSPTTSSPKEDMFGSVTWTNAKYKVRSPFVLDV